MAYKCPVSGCNGEYIGWHGFMVMDSSVLIRQCSKNPAHFYFMDEVASDLSRVISEREQRISTIVDQMRSQLSEEYPEAKFEMCFLDREESHSLYAKSVVSSTKIEIKTVAETGAKLGKKEGKTIKLADARQVTVTPDSEEIRLLNKYFVTDLIVRLEAEGKH